jgi:hypothetical protein
MHIMIMIIIIVIRSESFSATNTVIAIDNALKISQFLSSQDVMKLPIEYTQLNSVFRMAAIGIFYIYYLEDGGYLLLSVGMRDKLDNPQ